MSITLGKKRLLRPMLPLLGPVTFGETLILPPEVIIHMRLCSHYSEMATHVPGPRYLVVPTQCPLKFSEVFQFTTSRKRVNNKSTLHAEKAVFVARCRGSGGRWDPRTRFQTSQMSPASHLYLITVQCAQCRTKPGSHPLVCFCVMG